MIDICYIPVLRLPEPDPPICSCGNPVTKLPHRCLRSMISVDQRAIDTYVSVATIPGVADPVLRSVPPSTARTDPPTQHAFQSNGAFTILCSPFHATESADTFLMATIDPDRLAIGFNSAVKVGGYGPSLMSKPCTYTLDVWLGNGDVNVLIHITSDPGATSVVGTGSITSLLGVVEFPTHPLLVTATYLGPTVSFVNDRLYSSQPIDPSFQREAYHLPVCMRQRLLREGLLIKGDVYPTQLWPFGAMETVRRMSQEGLSGMASMRILPLGIRITFFFSLGRLQCPLCGDCDMARCSGLTMDELGKAVILLAADATGSSHSILRKLKQRPDGMCARPRTFGKIFPRNEE